MGSVKRLLQFLSLFFITLFLFSTRVAAQEAINNFKSDIAIEKSGVIDVKETIIYDFSSLYRHGIYRDIPYIKTNKEGKQFKLSIHIAGVTDEQGASYHYSTSSSNGTFELKIGDSDQTITGVHTYVITYTVSGALSYFSDHDELYWNTTGNEWTVPIEAAAQTVALPAAVKADQVKLACYTGISGSQESDCTATFVNGSAMVHTKAPLSLNEGLTTVVGFPKGIVAVLEPAAYTPFWQTWYGKALLAVILIILSLLALLWYVLYPIWIIIKWARFGRDPLSKGAVTAWYEAPKDKKGRFLTPAEVGVLIDEQVQMKDISALIVDLARRGYLRIEEKKKGDVVLVKLREFVNDSSLQPFEKEILSGIFDTGATAVTLKGKELYTTLDAVRKELYQSLVSNGFFEKDPHIIRSFYIGIAIAALCTANIFLFVVAVTFGLLMPRKTELGAEAAAVARGLKNFLSSQERQLTFQAKKQMMFEKLLPFAIAFGVEKIWANRFKDIDIKPPSWYRGYNQTGFNSYIFTNNLSSSLRSVSTAMTPVSSSSGFSSGFSGGSSGGGGGGGGGGSW